MFSKGSKTGGLPAQEGFTLVELIVVITIASIIMTTLVVQQSSWNDRLAISTQAYEMALMVRQAQIYGLGVRENTAGSGDKFDVGYGVYFDSNNTRYIFFADKDDANKGKYNAGDTIIETKTLTRGVTINRICGFISNNERCSPDMGLNKLVISFFRPEPKANLAFLNSSSPGNRINSFKSPAIIYLRSAGGKEFSIKVEANGQVSIVQ
jgi:prepilin-type N-terminal cleavage/methylation domain-containing protein